MKFVIGHVSFFKKLGYDTKYWRKNKNKTKTKTICHLEYAEILTHDLENNDKVQIIDAVEAREIMTTEEWSWEKNNLSHS